MTSQPKPSFRLARPLFIWEASASFVHTYHTSSATMKKCTSLGGTAIAAKCDVKEGFLVKWCTTLPSEGVEEDLLFGLWYIYIEEVFVGFSSP